MKLFPFLITFMYIHGVVTAIRVPSSWDKIEEDNESEPEDVPPPIKAESKSHKSRPTSNLSKLTANWAKYFEKIAPTILHPKKYNTNKYRGKKYRSKRITKTYPYKKYKKPSQNEDYHEEPLDIPTRPIYPGEGQWAKKGRKHKPFISPHRFLSKTKKEEPPPPPPNGYEIFLRNKKKFQRYPKKPKYRKPSQRHFSSYSVNEDTDFIPTKLYAQVRHTNEHVDVSDEDPHEPNLTESLKDTKIQTVYKEEGYEDSAYDHDNEKKNAREDEEYLEKHDDEVVAAESGRLEELVIDHPPKSTKPKIRTIKKISTLQKSLRQRIKRDLSDIEIDSNESDEPELEEKYPYYNVTNLPDNSPLRYAEDLSNIPKKTGNDLVFYKQADEKIHCPEIDPDIDPIPNRIKNNRDGNVKPPKMGPKLPRLKGLGTKIDCLKQKYFGKNPFDSPLFNEDTVLPVETIFKPYIKRYPKNETLRIDTNSTTVGLNILSDIMGQLNVTDKPKRELINTTKKPVRHRIKKTSSTTMKPTIKKRKAKSINVKKVPDNNTTTTSTTTTAEPLPNSEALILRRKIRPVMRRYRPHFHRNTIHSSSIEANTNKNSIKRNSEQLTVLHDVINNIRNSTKDLRESASSIENVIVKDEVVPPPPSPSSSYKKSNIREVPNSFIPSSEEYSTTGHSYIPITTMRPHRGSVKYSQYYDEVLKNGNVIFDSMRLRKKKFSTTSTTTTPNPTVQDSSLSSQENQIKIEDYPYRTIIKAPPPPRTFYVIGMRPPSPHRHYSLSVKYRLNSHWQKSYPPLQRRRTKRNASPGRLKYSELVRNRQKPIDLPPDQDDDYVPHRSRNYHYDETLGKIIYTNTPRTNSDEQLEDYIEVTEEVPSSRIGTSSTTTTTFKPAMISTQSSGEPTFLKILLAAKHQPGYRRIPFEKPTTTSTEKFQSTTITSSSTSNSEEFESTPSRFISGVRRPTTTTSTTEVNRKIAIPIDYSRYKTIQRNGDGPGQRTSEEGQDTMMKTARTLRPISTSTIGQKRRRGTTTTTPKNQITTSAATTTKMFRRRLRPTTTRVLITTTTDRMPLIRRRHYPAQTTATILRRIKRSPPPPPPPPPQDNNNRSYQSKRMIGLVIRHRSEPITTTTTTTPQPKSSIYFTDIALPRSINHLQINNEQFEDLDDESNNDDLLYDYHQQDDYPDEINSSTTEKLSYIKDPNKRLYYFAPI